MNASLKTKFMLEIEKEGRRSIELQLIERIYGPRRQTYGEIAEDFGVSAGTVATWARMMGLNWKSVAFEAMSRPGTVDHMSTRAIRSLASARQKAS